MHEEESQVTCLALALALALVMYNCAPTYLHKHKRGETKQLKDEFVKRSFTVHINGYNESMDNSEKKK